ncbi:hypothetical protein tpqmel_0543 [Candidatus Gastranaerophilus sp. (ex Termes propinquus)]|nr:hypothetical protein tpqmel_0543 [Candidatus Gastranaerophilus sp. (ex Termes propinquus)]
MEAYPELKQYSQQYLGDLACNFLDDIGDGIDFAFIDTAHTFPGEVIDFLMCYPYFKPDAMVVLHDTSLNLFSVPNHINCYVTGMLSSAIFGEKLQPDIDYLKHPEFAAPNITAVKLTPETGNRLWEVFNLLTHTWDYQLSSEQLHAILTHFEKFYSKDVSDFLNRINDFQNSYFKAKHTCTIASHKITKFHYRRYKLLSKITLGSMRKKYKEKKILVRELLSL